MAWLWALRRVPWRTVLLHAPTIVETARRFYGTTRPPASSDESANRSGDDLDALRRAVVELEAREGQQAALLADFARQVQAMASAIEVLRFRMLLALWGAAAALVVAIGAVIVVLRRLP
jgi:hypothetical protein